jgi:hypothetical protein
MFASVKRKVYLPFRKTGEYSYSDESSVESRHFESTKTIIKIKGFGS